MSVNVLALPPPFLEIRKTVKLTEKHLRKTADSMLNWLSIDIIPYYENVTKFSSTLREGTKKVRFFLVVGREGRGRGGKTH